MAIHLDKLTSFNAFVAENGNAKAIANVGEGGALVKHGKLGTMFDFTRLMRSGATKEANNTMRTELLKSLGAAFGMVEPRTDGRGTHFSAAFMKRLEDTLGKDIFKRGDFEIDADGLVASGKPLTQRRIKAIVTRLSELAQNPTEEPAIDKNVLEDFNDAKTEFLDDVQNGRVEDADMEQIGAFFKHVQKMIDILPKIPEAVRNRNKLDETGSCAFGELTGIVCHPDENTNELDHTEENYIAYMQRTLAEYTNMLMKRFLNDHSENKAASLRLPSGICMEAKTTAMQAEVAQMDTSLGTVADHNETTPLSECIGLEISAYRKNEHIGANDNLTWENVRDMLKKHLVGLTRPIDTCGTGMDTVPAKKTRKVTMADIDALAPYFKEMDIID